MKFKTIIFDDYQLVAIDINAQSIYELEEKTKDIGTLIYFFEVPIEYREYRRCVYELPYNVSRETFYRFKARFVKEWDSIRGDINEKKNR